MGELSTEPLLGAGDAAEIAQLKYRYLRTLDLKLWDEFESTLAEDVTGDYDGLHFTDRQELVSFMRESLGPRMITLHQAHHPEIDVRGDDATGRWYLEDKVLMPDHNLVLEGAAFYEDRYRRTPGGWVIAHTGYRRTYEATYALDAIPGYRLKIGDAYSNAMSG
jgi:hypothetical protein